MSDLPIALRFLQVKFRLQPEQHLASFPLQHLLYPQEQHLEQHLEYLEQPEHLEPPPHLEQLEQLDQQPHLYLY